MPHETQRQLTGGEPPCPRDGQNGTQRLQSIWVLLSARTGDNAQVLELAGRLGGDTVVKELTFNKLHHAPNWVLGGSLASLAPAARLKLDRQPWPDVVIAAGKRSVPVARWIRANSLGRAKLVQLGRPRAPIDDFDLVISTPQYGLPEHPRLIEIGLPFAVAKPVVASTLAKWRAEWKELPRPLTAVIVGAGKFPLSMPDDMLGRLGRLSSELAAREGGSLLVIMSPRSGPGAHLRLQRDISAPFRCYPWTAGGGNPYQAALALAGRFIVTCDSVSMISEALSTGKPVSLFLLPVSPLHITWRARRGIAAWLARSGLLQPPRDITRISRDLLEGGYVTELGAPHGVTRPFVRNDDVVIRRIEALLAASDDQNSLARRSAS